MTNTLKTLVALSLGLAALLPFTSEAQARWGQNPFGGNFTLPSLDIPKLTILLPDLIVEKVILSSSESNLAYVLVGNIGTAHSEPCRVMGFNHTGSGMSLVGGLAVGQYQWVRVHLTKGTFKGCHMFSGFRVDATGIIVELSEINNGKGYIDNSDC